MPEEATGGDSVDTAAALDFLESNFDSYAEPEQVPGEADPTPAAAQEQTPTPDLLGPDPDVSDLPPDVQAIVNQRVKELRQGFTKRTTELADANRILEAAGGDPQAVLDAYEFAQTLQDDSPEGHEARTNLYQRLQALYAEEQQAPSAPTPEDPFSEYDLPPEIKDALSLVPQLKSQLDEINGARQEFAAEQARQAYLEQVVDDLSSTWNDIVSEYPDLKGRNADEAAQIEEDVFALGAHTNGDLAAALDLYRRIESRGQQALFEGSANVPGGMVSPPAGGGHSTEPVQIETIKDAKAPALEYLERAFSQDM